MYLLTCSDMVNNKTLVSTLAYVKQEIHGIVANKGAGHFHKEHIYVCNVGYNTAPLCLSWHAIM
jgi:hypothetical protein